MPFQNVQNLFCWLKTKKVIPKHSLELKTDKNLPLPRDIQRTWTPTWTSPTGLSWLPPCCPSTTSPAAQKVWGGGSYLKFGKIHSFSWFESNSSLSQCSCPVFVCLFQFVGTRPQAQWLWNIFWQFWETCRVKITLFGAKGTAFGYILIIPPHFNYGTPLWHSGVSGMVQVLNEPKNELYLLLFWTPQYLYLGHWWTVFISFTFHRQFLDSFWEVRSCRVQSW